MTTDIPHNYSGMMLDGRFMNLCADCREKVGPLTFQGMGRTIRKCDMCGAEPKDFATAALNGEGES